MKRVLIALLFVGIAVGLTRFGTVAAETARRGAECVATFDNGDTLYTTLQDAIDDAQSGDTVKIAGLCGGVEAKTFVLSPMLSETIYQVAYINKSLTLEGGYAVDKWTDPPDPETNPTVLDADSGGRVVVVRNEILSQDIAVTISHLTLRNGDSNGEDFPSGIDSGGGIQSNDATLVINHSMISENSAEFGAGIAFHGDDTLTINASQLILNIASDNGGGLHHVGTADITITDSDFDRNTSGGGGGGVYHDSTSNQGSLTIHSGTFDTNEATGDGGGLYVTAPLTLTASTVTENIAGADGGGLSGNNRIVIRDSTIARNSATLGGGINAESGLTATDSHITLNSASGNGGGLRIKAPSVLNNSTISNNTSDAQGGGINVFTSSASLAIAISDSTLVGNHANSLGGGIYSQGELTVMLSMLTNNSSDSSGGGLFTRSGEVRFINSTLMGNSADINGGAVANGFAATGGDAEIFLTSSTVSNNTAANGAGIHNHSGGVTLSNSTVSMNTAASSGGGIYNQDSVQLRNATLSNNAATTDGGGIYNRFSGFVSLQNSIIANSTGAGDCFNQQNGSLSGTVSALNSLIQMTGNDACSVMNNVNGNITDDDAGLGPLQDNGGATHTHALPSDSPAVDAGYNVGGICPSTDQRGLSRIDNLCDMGAYEFGAVPTAVGLSTQAASSHDSATMLLQAVIIGMMTLAMLKRSRRK